jgi:hypothetical protein
LPIVSFGIARIVDTMTTRTMYDRAAMMMSGTQLTRSITIKVDPRVLADCESLEILHRGHSRAHCPTVSQWVTTQMIRAIKEELTKKGLGE